VAKHSAAGRVDVSARVEDETLRIEVGSAATSDLAVENIELSTEEISRAVRRSVIARRAGITGLSTNRLRMGEVRLPDAVVSAREPRAA